jgi:hypothetical protein
MARETRGQKIGKLLDAKEKDSDNTYIALKLQVLAWRQIALIGLDDKERGRKLCQTMFFNTLPFVNDVIVKQIIAETEADAAEAGKRAGVFTS